MNHTRLVGIIKTLVTEVHHGQRYRGKLSGRPNKLNQRAIPDKQLQVAEEDDKDKESINKPVTGKTMTGSTPNKLIQPEYNPNMVQHPQGSKPPETK